MAEEETNGIIEQRPDDARDIAKFEWGYYQYCPLCNRKIEVSVFKNEQLAISNYEREKLAVADIINMCGCQLEPLPTTKCQLYDWAEKCQMTSQHPWEEGWMLQVSDITISGQKNFHPEIATCPIHADPDNDDDDDEDVEFEEERDEPTLKIININTGQIEVDDDKVNINDLFFNIERLEWDDDNCTGTIYIRVFETEVLVNENGKKKEVTSWDLTTVSTDCEHTIEAVRRAIRNKHYAEKNGYIHMKEALFHHIIVQDYCIIYNEMHKVDLDEVDEAYDDEYRHDQGGQPAEMFP
jgi:hypothetical protein